MRNTAFVGARFFALVALSLAFSFTMPATAGSVVVRYQDADVTALAFSILPSAEFDLVIRTQGHSTVIPPRIRKTHGALEKLRAVGDSSASGMNFTASEQDVGHQHAAVPLCLLQFGSSSHLRVTSQTGLSDQIVKKILVMHESAHCLLGQKIAEGVDLKKSTGSLPDASRQWFPPALLAIMTASIDNEWPARLSATSPAEIAHWQEVFCDLLAFMTLAQRGEDVSTPLEKMIRFRAINGKSDRAHDSSSSLRKLQAFLGDVKKLPERQQQFKALARSDLHLLVLELMHQDRDTWPHPSDA